MHKYENSENPSKDGISAIVPLSIITKTARVVANF